MAVDPNGRSKRRVARIKTIPIAKILFDLGYPVHPDGGDREQQFPCDLHGDGQDGKPSARLYPDSQTAYCFACGRSRDAIEIIREKKGLDFNEALSYLEKAYHLPSLPWEPTDVREPTAEEQIAEKLHPVLSFEDAMKSFREFMLSLTQDRLFSLPDTLGFWDAYDQLLYRVLKDKTLSDEQGKAILVALRDRVVKKCSTK